MPNAEEPSCPASSAGFEVQSGFLPQCRGKRNTLQFGVDIKNFLNLLNSDWGIYKTVNNTSLLSYKSGAYQFQKNGGKKLTDTYSNLNSFNSTYSIQFSVRYIFN